MSWITATPERLRTRVNRNIRDAVGLTSGPPPRCDDPDEAYFPVDGVSRIVHGDLASMLVGGIGSLFFQMLHPHSMAGVAQHSRYQHDPLGRLLQTANFIGTTTYGTSSGAYAAIERVLAVHQSVRGVADDGVAYYANDPHLLEWVHCAEMSMFLAGYQRFGRYHLSAADADRYVAEMAVLATDLGVLDPPTTLDGLRARLLRYRPELRESADAIEARDFVTTGVLTSATQRVAYWFLVRSAYGLMEPWARELLGVRDHRIRDRVVVRPLATVLCRAMRVFVPPAPRYVASDNPPSTTTT